MIFRCNMLAVAKFTIGWALLGSSFSVLATETRLQTLRFNGGADDETLVFTYPGQITKYNVALIELGTSGSTEAYGAAMTDIGSMSIGAAVSRTDWLFTESWLSRSGLGSAKVSLLDLYEDAMLDAAAGNKDRYLYRPSRPFEFLMGFKLGEGTLGFRLAFADYKNKSESTVASVNSKTEFAAQQTQLGVGFHSGTMDVAVTLDPSANQKRSETANGADSSTAVKGSSFAIDGRWVEAENKSGTYAKGKIATRTFKASGTAAGKGFSGKFTDQMITLEGGYAAVKDLKGPKLFTGVELMQNASKGPTVTGTGVGSKTVPSYLANDESASLSSTVMSATLSGEADVMGGFGMMAGMNYVLFGDQELKNNTTSQDVKIVKSFDETADSALWTLGMYYRVDALKIDASYDKQILYNGPFLLSGIPSTKFIGKISASYAF